MVDDFVLTRFDHHSTTNWPTTGHIPIKYSPHSYQLPTTFPPSAIIWVTNTKATSAPPSSANMAYRHRCFATSKTRSLQVPLHQDLKFTMTWDGKYKRTVFVKKDNLPKQIDLSYIPEWPVDWNGKGIVYTNSSNRQVFFRYAINRSALSFIVVQQVFCHENCVLPSELFRFKKLQWLKVKSLSHFYPATPMRLRIPVVVCRHD